MTFVRQPADSPAIRQCHQAEDVWLASYAMHTKDTRGRRHYEPPHPYRPDYVRDRDRVIHSSAFRRLMYKTQVFVGQPNDYQRTRLTHTLEVAQVARTVARNLRLNEDLTEAVALAHDLGHPPFGHAGERALAELMKGHGGFEHNRQGLRLVEKLEQRYPSFPGLNLTFEVLQSIALHSKERSHPALADLDPQQQMLAESQVVDLADSIAYDTHDIDDALRAGLIGFEDLRQIPMWKLAEERAAATYGPGLEGAELSRAVIRSLIDWQVSSLLQESTRLLSDCDSPVKVQSAARNVIALSPEVQTLKRDLEVFLFDRVYRHEQVVRTTRIAERLIAQIFEELVRDPTALPEHHRRRLEEEPVERVVCDYVAGMTDRYAQRTHRMLFEP